MPDVITTFSAESADQDRGRRTRLSSSAIVAATLTTVIAVSAFSLSFYALAHLARMTGVFPEPFPYVMPVIVDLFVLQATFSLVTASAKHDKKGSRYHWFMLAVFSGASIIGNAYHAVVVSSGDLPAYVSALIAVVPPLALLASTHGLVNLLWDPSMTSATGVETPAALVAAPSPQPSGEGSADAVAVKSVDVTVESADTLSNSIGTAAERIPHDDTKPGEQADAGISEDQQPHIPAALTTDGPATEPTAIAPVTSPSISTDGTPNDSVAELLRAPITRHGSTVNRDQPERSEETGTPSSLHALARGVRLTDEHRRLARIVQEEGSVNSDVEEIATVLALSAEGWTKASIAKVVTPHRTTITRWIERAENLQDEGAAQHLMDSVS